MAIEAAFAGYLGDDVVGAFGSGVGPPSFGETAFIAHLRASFGGICAMPKPTKRRETDNFSRIEFGLVP